MSKCIKCGANFVGTPEEPSTATLCRSCEIEQLKAEVERLKRTNEILGKHQPELCDEREMENRQLRTQLAAAMKGEIK